MIRHGGTDQAAAKSTLILNLPLPKLFRCFEPEAAAVAVAHRTDRKHAYQAEACLCLYFTSIIMLKTQPFGTYLGYLILSQIFTYRIGIISASLSLLCLSWITKRETTAQILQ